MEKPAELAKAQLYLGILRQFSGYTLSSLKEEDPELLKLLYIEHLGTRREVDDGISGEHYRYRVD